jgi:hypothetical protein
MFARMLCLRLRFMSFVREVFFISRIQLTSWLAAFALIVLRIIRRQGNSQVEEK